MIKCLFLKEITVNGFLYVPLFSEIFFFMVINSLLSSASSLVGFAHIVNSSFIFWQSLFKFGTMIAYGVKIKANVSDCRYDLVVQGYLIICVQKNSPCAKYIVS